MEGKMCNGHNVAWALVFIGAVNWGLVGLFNWDVVKVILGGTPTIMRIVYVLIGVSALFMLGKAKCKMCK